MYPSLLELFDAPATSMARSNPKYIERSLTLEAAISELDAVVAWMDVSILVDRVTRLFRRRASCFVCSEHGPLLPAKTRCLMQGTRL